MATSFRLSIAFATLNLAAEPFAAPVTMRDVGFAVGTGSQTLTAERFSVPITHRSVGLNWSGSTPAAAPGPNETRISHTRLFADVARTTVLSGGSVGGNIVSPARGSVAAPKSDFLWGVYGPHYQYVEKFCNWAWDNLGGDWFNTAGTRQGTSLPHFTFAANSVTSGSAAYTGITATLGAQDAFMRGKWNAYIVKVTGGSRAIAALHHPTLAAPAMSVTYADTTTATLACTACVALNIGSSYTQIGAEESVLNVSVALEFEMPTKPVTSATIALYVTQHTATAATINGYMASPPQNKEVETDGIAADYPGDIGIGANPAVLFHQQFTTTTLSDYIISTPSAINTFAIANWNPSVISSGTNDDTKLPTALSGVAISGTNKWFYKQNTASNLSIVNSSYTADGYTSPPSGQGSLRVVLPGSAAADGANVGSGGALGADLWALFDKAICGTLSTFTVRFYYRYHISGGAGDIAGLKMFRSSSGGSAAYAVPRGKFGPGGHCWTSTGGNNNVGGGILGWSNRGVYVDAPADLSVQPRNIGAHVQDMIPGENFEAGQNGGLGAAVYQDIWYCVEIETTLNTNDHVTGVALADGVMRIKINGRLDATYTGWKFREGITPAQGTSGDTLAPFRSMGAIGLLLNDYNGGVMAPDRDVIHFYSNIVCTDGPTIGPVAPPLPSWVPAAGNVATMSVGNGLLTNTLRSTVATYYEGFYYAGCVNNYNGSVPNPWHGTYGSIVLEGGGHSYSNDNTVPQLDLSSTGATHRRVTNPTAIYGSDSSQATKDANSVGNTISLMDSVNCEYPQPTYDGQPTSRHSYGDQNIVGPNRAGGAAFGAFYRTLEWGGGFAYNNTIGAEVAHAIAFNSLTGTSQYRRASPARYYIPGGGSANTAIIGQPCWSVHVPPQERIYMDAHGGEYAVRWLDLVTNRFVSGTGTPLNDKGQGNGAMHVYVPERSLIIHADRKTGVLRLRTMDVSSSDPSWNNTARTLSSSLTIGDGWSEIAWWKDRLIVANITGDNTGVYEITIPSDLTTTWTVTRYAMGGVGSVGFRPADAGHGYKRWAVLKNVKSILYYPKAAQDASQSADEVVWVYRPRNT